MAIQMRDVAAAVGDRFRLEQKIGSGGSAVVYRAEDTRNHRKVAIKVLRPELGSGVADSRFEREIEVAARLTHPHILPLHDSGFTDSLSFYVMPFVDGESLRERLKREGALPISEAVRIGREVADALSYAHDQGVVHRDIKPGNIMLESGHAVVADFGIAALPSPVHADRLTDTGQSPGTLLYMSPEQIAAESRVDGRSDIYSLGCLIYEMLAGEPPFTGATNQAIIGRKLAGDMPSLRAVREVVPAELEEIVGRTLARAPADRFKTAKEVEEALGSLGSGRLTPLPEPSRRKRRRNTPEQILPLLLGAGLVAAVGAAAIGFLSTNAFDIKLGIPEAYRPSRSDVLVVGVRALVPFTVFGLLGVGILVLVKQLLRRARSTITRVPGTRGARNAFDQRISQPWRRMLGDAQTSTVTDTFFVASIAISALVLLRFQELLGTLWYPDTAALACANRPEHLAFTFWMVGLIGGLSATWFSVFRWARNRPGSDVRLSLARWGSLAWIAALIFVSTVPWRVMWDAEGERVRISGERAYVLSELDNALLLYDPDRRVTRRYDMTSDDEIERLGMAGYFFEEPEVFESNREACQAVRIQP